MNPQDIIERDVRLLIGDLSVQLIAARARIAELEDQQEQQAEKVPPNDTGKQAEGQAP